MRPIDNCVESLIEANSFIICLLDKFVMLNSKLSSAKIIDDNLELDPAISGLLLP